MIPEKFIKLAALGAMGVAPGTFGAYLLALLLIRPSPTGGMPGSGGGFDWTGWWALAAAVLSPVTLIAAWHVDFGKQLKAGKNSCPGV